MTLRQELSSLIRELTDVYDELVHMDDTCEYKETSKIVREAIKNVNDELTKHKNTLKHLIENDPDVAKEVAEEKARDKEEFGWNGRIYESALHE